MRLEVFLSLFGVRPRWIAREYLLAQFLCDPKTFACSHTRDSIAPISILRLACGAPVTFNEIPDVARDHQGSL